MNFRPTPRIFTGAALLGISLVFSGIGYSIEEPFVFLVLCLVAIVVLPASFEGLYHGITYRAIALTNVSVWCLFAFVCLGYFVRHHELPILI